MTTPLLPLDAPATPPACPGCGGLMGDGDRVSHGRCGGCHLRARLRQPRCWCGRRVSTLPDNNGTDCAEHDAPLPAPSGPSEPLTPGGILDPHYP